MDSKRLLAIVLLFGAALAPCIRPTYPGSASKASPASVVARPAALQTAAVADPLAANAAPAGVPDGWWPQAQRQLRDAEYGIVWQNSTPLPGLPAAYQAPNRAHNLRTYFAPDGARVTPRNAASSRWEWGLMLRGYGSANAVRSPDDASLHVAGNRIEYRRGDLTEWYVNDRLGLEQGFTLARPPADAGGQMVIDLALRGTLAASQPGSAQMIEFAAGAGEAVLRYGDPRTADAAGRALPTHMRLLDDARTIRIEVDATGATYPITIDPLATSPSQTLDGEQSNAVFGVVTTAGDVNGDGFADTLVSALGYDGGDADEGRVWLYLGSANGTDVAPDWKAESNQAGANFGFSIATAGDVNGDGFSDVLIGAQLFDDGETDEGRAFVWYGSANGLGADGTPSNADWSHESDQASAYFGTRVSTAGDVNGDGFSDIIVGADWYDNGQADEGRAYAFYGSAGGLSDTPNWNAESDQAGAFFGFGVSTAGDVNGDGFSDVIVGARLFNNPENNEGRAYLYYGSAAGLSNGAGWTAEGDQPHAFFGSTVATAGDVNGDGFSDVIVGAPGYDRGSSLDEGRATVYFGAADGLHTAADWTSYGFQASAGFGSDVATAGDVNGDGFADIAVGMPFFDNSQVDGGAAYIYFGSQGGPSYSPNWWHYGDQASAYVGTRVSTAGDVNGDGFSDVLVGADGYDVSAANDNKGRVFLFHGGSYGPSIYPNWTSEGDQTEYPYFGAAVAGAGDVNGDGFSDVIVGAPYYDNPQADEGRAFVYLGSANGLKTTPDWLAESNQENAYFGFAVAGAGDVNGDGFDDVLVGSPYYDNEQEDEGRAYLYLGSPSGPNASPSWTFESNQANAMLGLAVAGAGDVNGDGFSDVIVGAPNYANEQDEEGRALVFHGSAMGLSPTPSWAAEPDQQHANFGHAVAGAGDVNGDGFSDVIVGAPFYTGGQPNEGRAFVYLGSAGGLQSNPGWYDESDQDSAYFGWSVSSAGDANGDGFSDVIVSAPYYDGGITNQGRVNGYYGSASGLSTSAGWTVSGSQSNAFFGDTIGNAGDVNGDGFSDVLVGSPYYDNGEQSEGIAYVYLGATSGLRTSAEWSYEGNQASGYFAEAVAGAGDVNGDGYADVIGGADSYDGDQPNEGRAFAFYGNGGNWSTWVSSLPRQRRQDDSAQIGTGGLSNTNAFRLLLRGRLPFGRGKVRLEWEVKPLGTSFNSSGRQQSDTWLDSGTAGVQFNQLVNGLSFNTAYHWRVRVRYQPASSPYQLASRWITQADNGWNEQDLRTPQANPPQVTALNPNQGRADQPTTVIITGARFVATPSVTLGTQSLSNVSLVDSTHIQATIPAGLPIGTYDLTVRNPDGQLGSLAAAFTVVAPPPQVVTVQPADGRTNVANDINVYGVNFAPGVVVKLGGTTLTSDRLNSTVLRATVPPGLDPASYPLSVTNPGGDQSTLPAAYTVLPASASGGDTFEPDNSCAQARPINVDGTVQNHSFHQAADQDWIAFNGNAGTTYRIAANVPSGSPADVVMEVFTQCGTPPSDSQDFDFSPGTRLEFPAPTTGTYYVRLTNHTAATAGDNVTYSFNVRDTSLTSPSGAVVIVGGRLKDNDPLQPNINHVTDAVYQLFLQKGYTPDRIYYLSTDLSRAGVDGASTAANLQAAITTWAQDKVGTDSPFTLFIMDHGGPNLIYLDEPGGKKERVTPDQLDSWIGQLETSRPGLKVNIFIEACNSGSFLDLPQKVSKAGRVVIASTSANSVAYASAGGAVFSDYMLTALQQGETVYSSFQIAKNAANVAHVVQTPWIDDNGDGVPNTAADGQEAQRRGFNIGGTLDTPSWQPYIAEAKGPDKIVNSQGVIQAKVFDNVSVRRVYAVIYPPSYQPPANQEELVQETLPTIVLLDQGSNQFRAIYTGFNERGVYRVVVFAEDNEGTVSQPVAIEVSTVANKVLLPLITR